MYQQVFLPASKGLMTSAPASLIPDGAFAECNNVRFDDGYVEKAKGFTLYKTVEDGSHILGVNQFIADDGLPKNMVHTPTGLYWVRDELNSFTNLIQDTYAVSGVGHISTDSVFNQYFFCALGTDVYYWDGEDTKARKLEGLFNAPEWQASHLYKVGDVVKPTAAHYSGYVYKCTTQGTSGGSEPTWQANLSTAITDGSCRWIGIGSDEVEGNSAKSVRAQCIGDYKDFLFIANTEEDGSSYPSRLRWSQWQNPRLWHNNEDGSGLAGYVDVNDTAGKIMAVKKIGDILVVYKEDGIVAISYTGGDTTFSKELITTQTGLIAPKAVVSLSHSHIFVGRDNIYQFDGNSVMPIGDDIRKFFFKDLTSVLSVVGFYNSESGDVIFAYNNTLEDTRVLNKAITYNTFTHTWAVRDINATCIGDFDDNRDPLINEIDYPYDSTRMNEVMIDDSLYKRQKGIITIGTADGKIYKLEGYADSRGDYDGYVVSKIHHMDDPGHIKRLLRIQFHVQSQINCDMYVQVRPLWQADISEEGAEWESAPTFTFKFVADDDSRPVTPPYVDIDLSARYFQIKFGTRHNNEYFKVLGYTLYYQTRGDI